jgi:oxygen-independent coproporphyrinogen-3 oxidase
MERMDISIYLHFPFCLNKCPYCNFASCVVHPIPERQYIKALLGELNFIVKQYSLQGICVKSVYFGGGTPSLFSTSSLETILNALSKNFLLAENAEITIEANPGTIDKVKLRSYHSLGINRLNLGCQSFQDRLLGVLGRIHNGHQSLEAFSLARQCGFDNVGIDLIYAIPGQTLADLETDLETALNFYPEHIAAYELTVEKETPFSSMVAHGKLSIQNEDKQIAMFHLCHDRLEAEGYSHYEISNYARPDFYSIHNMRYWQLRSYIGLGAGAHSYVKSPHRKVFWGLHWENPSSWKEYTFGKALCSRKEEQLTRKQVIQETLFLGLRMQEGIAVSEFFDIFGTDALKPYEEFFEQLESNGLITFQEDRLRLTKEGMLLSDEIFLNFF